MRHISEKFWTDTKVESMTPEEKFLFLFLLSNPHTNLCGCYEISVRQISYETGLGTGDVERILGRLDGVYNVIRYDAGTCELLVLRWSRYNWTASTKLDKALLGEIRGIKSDAFRAFLAGLYNARSSVTEPIDPEGAASAATLPQSGAGAQRKQKETAGGEPGVEEAWGGAAQGLSPCADPGGGYIKAQQRKPPKPDIFDTFAGDDAELLEALRAFEKMRKTIKKPMTERAKELLVRKLEAEFLRDEWIAILNQSTMNCWQGIFPLKADGGSGGRSGGENGTGNPFFDALREGGYDIQ